MSKVKTVAIIGAGPVGLAAAAHALERGLKPIVLEAGPEAGHAVRQWEHVQMFSPWEYNVDRAAERLLAPTGWNSPDPQHYPTGAELVERYLDPLATSTALKDVIHTSSRVTAISRAGFDKVKTRAANRRRSRSATRTARGRSRSAPTPLSTRRGRGIAEPGGRERPAGDRRARGAVERITYAMPDVLGRDREPLCRQDRRRARRGHSAIGTLIDLDALRRRRQAPHVIWLLTRQRSREGLRRRRQRQARRPRRTRRALRPLVGSGLSGSKRALPCRTSASHGRSTSGSQRLRLLRPSCRRRRTDRRDRLPARAVVPEGVRLRSIRRSSVRPRWRP